MNLLEAAENGQLSAVQHFLNIPHVDLKKEVDWSGNTPLHQAACEGHEDIVCALLDDNRIDPNVTNNGGFTPLYFAAYHGHRDVVRAMLQDPRVDRTKTFGDGKTARDEAMARGHADIVTLFDTMPDQRMAAHNRVAPMRTSPVAARSYSEHFQSEVKSRREAESRLIGFPGAFMVRGSSMGDHCVALSANNAGTIDHFLLHSENGVWIESNIKSPHTGTSVDDLLSKIYPTCTLINMGKFSMRATT